MKPDFKTFTDEEVRASYTLIQRLCYEYTKDKEVTEVLKRVYKDLQDERPSRKITESAEHRDITGKEQHSSFKPQVTEKPTKSPATNFGVGMKPKLCIKFKKTEG